MTETDHGDGGPGARPSARRGARESPPADVLYRLITGYYVSCAIYAATALGLPDLLAGGPRTHEQLARESGAHAESVRRLLRLLASVAVTVEREDGAFELTAVGDHLCSDSEHSLRAVALQFAGPGQQRPWGDLEYSVRTGTAAFEHAQGVDPFSFLREHPEQAAVFNAAMAFLGGQVGAALAYGEAYDFGALRTLVDVGGGHGTLLAGVLEAHPRLCGTIFELPYVAAGAERLIAERGLSERCSVVTGDVFVDPLPAGADAYLLKHVIHDFDDGRAVEILCRCREAMGADGRVLLVEGVLPDRVEPSPFDLRLAGSDLNMLVQLGGRERTESEFGSLVEAAGLRVVQIVRVGDLPCGMLGTTSIIETVAG